MVETTPYQILLVEELKKLHHHMVDLQQQLMDNGTLLETKEIQQHIILLVKDKSAVEEKLRKAIRKYITEEATHVFGMTELFAALTKLKL